MITELGTKARTKNIYHKGRILLPKLVHLALGEGTGIKFPRTNFNGLVD